MHRAARLLTLATLAGAALCIPAVTARAAEQPAALGGYGVIDMEKVSEQATPVKEASKELGSFRQTLMENLREIDQYTYLTAAEVRELGSTLETTNDKWTPMQKGRYNELKQAALDRDKEFSALAQTPNPTAEQKKRLDELSKMRGEKDQPFDEIKARYEQKLNQRAAEILPKLAKVVEDVIQGIAKDQKLAIVLTKRTQNGKDDVVLWGGTDITDELVKRLNKAK